MTGLLRGDPLNDSDRLKRYELALLRVRDINNALDVASVVDDALSDLCLSCRGSGKGIMRPYMCCPNCKFDKYGDRVIEDCGRHHPPCSRCSGTGRTP